MHDRKSIAIARRRTVRNRLQMLPPIDFKILAGIEHIKAAHP